MKNFKDIAGYEAEKEQLQSLAGVLKRNKELKEMGGRLPKGLLLIGGNGVGKSLMAEAFINESNLNYMLVNSSVSDDDFDEYINGVFEDASHKTPCIILIEEIDKLVGNNDMFPMGANFNRFTSLLNTMNKYKNDEIFVLGTANYGLRIDRSLIRSGRIDNIAHIDFPTENDRKELYEFYAKNKTVSSKVKYQDIAKQSVFFSCADIETVMNEATIIACKDNRKEISKKDIETAITNKKFASFERKSEMSATYQRVVATHEAGHAVAMLFGPEKDIRRVTILPRGGTRGYAEHMNNFESKMLSAKEKENLIAVSLAGMASEKVFYGVTFDGSRQDLNTAMEIAHSLICYDGVKGFEYLVSNDEPMENVSQKKQEMIESAESELFKNKFDETVELLKKHCKLVTNIVDNLVEKKLLEKDDLEYIFNEYLKTLEKKERAEINARLKEKYEIRFIEENVQETSGRW